MLFRSGCYIWVFKFFKHRALIVHRGSPLFTCKNRAFGLQRQEVAANKDKQYREGIIQDVAAKREYARIGGVFMESQFGVENKTILKYGLR